MKPARRRSWINAVPVFVATMFGSSSSFGQSSPVDIVKIIVAREVDAQAHKLQFDYLSVERSERTGGKRGQST